jgi:hypothetical protein
VVRFPENTAQPVAASNARSSSVATLEPEVVPIPLVEEIHQRWIEILHRPDREIVAVLELLSPSNKSSSRGQYLSKRAHFHREEVHLVELDLLLGGARLPMGRPLPAGDFYAIVARADRRPAAEVYAWTLRDRLPSIPVPLLKPDKDIFVDLSDIYARSFERGRYARSIDYGAPLNVPMDAGLKQWILQTTQQI